MHRPSLHHRVRLAVLWLATVATSCGGADDPPPSGSGLPPAPSGAGYCCPIDPITCNCFRHGGWVAVDDVEQCPLLCDLAPPGSEIAADENGCPELNGPTSCLPLPP